MKRVILALILCLTGCDVVAEQRQPIAPMTPVIVGTNIQYGSTTMCDDFGCRAVKNTRYFVGSDGVTYYWDIHFGVWIGSSGYWNGTSFYRGYYPGYHTYYHQGFYSRVDRDHERGGYAGHPGRERR